MNVITPGISTSSGRWTRAHARRHGALQRERVLRVPAGRACAEEDAPGGHM